MGSGSAGAVIASGLTGKVLVIEAGSKGGGFLFNIPIVQPFLQKSSFDWGLQTSPQVNACLALKDNKSQWPLGKILGGSHRLNNLIYYRGHPSDYEAFLSAEEAESIFDDIEKNFPINSGAFKSVVSEAFKEAGRELGFDDFHHTNLTQLKGWRYTQVEHWKALGSSPEVVNNAEVTRILFDDEDPKKAVGVEFFKHGELHKVYGRNVVLSAGAIGSPKILMLSGIGSREHLEEIGIKVVENLPVGENLQDHVTTGLDLIILNQTIGLSVKDLINPFKVLDFFFYEGEGSPLAFGGADAMGFARLNASNDFPDLSFILLPVGMVADHGIHLRRILNIRDEIWDENFKPLVGQTTISILPVLLHPKSKGNVRLVSKNFKDAPVIDAKYLTHKDDIKNLVTGVRIIEKLVETPAMKKFGAEINPKRFPGCEKYFFDSNDYWECFIRHMTLTMFHPVGTCKVGAFNEASTVVLPDFRVKNVKNLFVVDGSVLEKAPSANPHAIIAMLAQKFVNIMAAS